MKTLNYKKSYYAVNSFLLEQKINIYPLDLFDLIPEIGYSLTTYSELSEEMKVTIDYICKEFKTQDAFTIYSNKKYKIFYNDQIKNKHRINFSLAHELGHILLNHINKNGTIIKRTSNNGAQSMILKKQSLIYSLEIY